MKILLLDKNLIIFQYTVNLKIKYDAITSNIYLYNAVKFYIRGQEIFNIKSKPKLKTLFLLRIDISEKFYFF